MSGADLKQAAERMAKRKEILKQPVPMRPDEPENIKLSKAEFIAKRRAEKEEAVEKEKVWAEHKAKKLTHPVITFIRPPLAAIAEEGEIKEVKKAGRPKKVE